ncbi:hypothetical protein Ppa06_01570 [Planomonospora parontospora subsp. parontospora]|uniref:DUF885 domain-containing protein n=2 Tax=Planomonospora parontospora TaxID=58119 RepID=A0AA37F212_9ACTN|nr:DUF885 domain-containing protein [Planomonospora parontospora]GGK45695.1 hypothetical protein GCM10010126_01580 [Planomonospora parontospora]GII06359.1 hypothetical protein Ppa06_01570 [Planomonospora parontospora subsp. parontospora]
MTDLSPDSARLVDDFLDWYLDANPVRASLAGAPGHDRTLGDFTEAGITAREAEARRRLARLEAAGDADGGQGEEGGGFEDRIDRELVVSALRGSVAQEAWPSWRRDPSFYVGPVFASMFSPFLHRLAPEAELVDAAVARLAEVPGVLAACRTNLDRGLAAPLLVERGLGQARTGRHFLTVTVPGLVGDERLRARLAEAAEPAAAAFDALVEFLGGFAAEGDWRMGEELYSRLLREREMLDYGAAGLRERGRAAYDELDAEMREVAARLPGGSGDWHAAIAALQDDHAPTLEDMRAEYEAETERARRFVRERGLVTFAEGEECRVVPSPEFQRPVLSVASYLSPPPLSASRTGHFFVPFTPDSFTAEQVRQRLRTNARAQMPSIAVHEAYPGHHWHLSWAAGNPRRARKLFGTPYFAEGWALYVEKAMREQGYFAEPAQELAHLEFRLFRAARIIVDTSLHCGDMSIEEAELFMTTKSSLTPGTAKGEVDRYCAWPTQAPSYLTGALEIDRIRADYLAAGRGDLRSFHDTLAGSGSLPLGLARRVALEGRAGAGGTA